ncbi:Sdh8 protein [Martiniozyma asiatica (nom. inval.)]|nr:Sdh8 protein [Martiniozyma asiatica]
MFKCLKAISAARLSNIRFYTSKPAFMTKGPAPPSLNENDQKEFDALVQQANTQIAIEDYNEKQGFKEQQVAPAIKTSDIGTFGSQMQTIPEFEGDVNPKTGEVNGPKQEPVRHGDWSFNGRVTDF